MTQRKIETYTFFSVPVTIMNFGEESDELNERLVKDALNEKKLNPTSSRSAINGWQSGVGMENRYQSFFELRGYIKQVIETTLPTLGFTITDFDNYFKCDELWVNIIEEQGGFHVPHIHGTGETLFSGVYYPLDYIISEGEESDIRATSVPEPGDLMLFDPASTEKRAVIPQSIVNRYPYYGSEICIRPRKGNLVIFPSYLSHMVAPIYGENVPKMRMSISFSYSKKI